ncbi:MAG: Rieske 2Fe-2S domain-containing protein [Candidatus Neomarinimicrobiota bacterium]
MTDPKNIDPADQETASLPRKQFIARTAGVIGWASLWTWLAGSTMAAVRFFFPRVRYEPPTKFKIGRPEDFIMNTIDSRWLKEHRIYVVRQPEGIYVLKALCTHLGCLVTWFNTEETFKCPCHGSFFTVDGDVIGGPAPEPLARNAVSLDRTGNIVVDSVQNTSSPDQRETGVFLLKV